MKPNDMEVELMPLNNQNLEQQEQQSVLPLEGTEDDYEVITSEEVDRVLDVLDQLIADVDSENVRAYLEDAAECIYSLIYADGEEQADAEQGPGIPQPEAA